MLPAQLKNSVILLSYNQFVSVFTLINCTFVVVPAQKQVTKPKCSIPSSYFRQLSVQLTLCQPVLSYFRRACTENPVAHRGFESLLLQYVRLCRPALRLILQLLGPGPHAAGLAGRTDTIGIRGKYTVLFRLNWLGCVFIVPRLCEKKKGCTQSGTTSAETQSRICSALN